MFKKFNELKNDMSKLKDIQKQLSDVDMSDPKAMLESFGVDYDELEKSFTHTGFEPTQIDYTFKSVNPEPKYHYGSDSGFDLRANEKVTLEPFGRALIPTGLYIDVPQRSEVQVRPKSGLTIKKGLTVLNTPGTVDEGYRGDVGIIAVNLSNEEYTIQPGERIAQAVIMNVIGHGVSNLEKVKTLSETERGDTGYGSSGKN